MSGENELPSDKAVWPWMTDYLAKVFEWVEKAPEDQTAMMIYVDKIPVFMDDQVIGHIHTGDEMRFEPAESF